jgi:diguanylate cyclase (GGDEF)-like protein/PAS domain S-box-containing protein
LPSLHAVESLEAVPLPERNYDVTRVADRRLEDHQSLRVLVERLREGIYITNLRGEILDANPAFLEVVGLADLTEARRWNVTDLMADPAERAAELAALERAGEVREFEFRIRRPDGTVRTVVDSCFLLGEPDGESLVYGILVDITRRKEMESELRELSLRDPLTGCYNRRYLADFALTVESDPETRWGAILIDLDHFKEWNDQYGHAEGDKVLVRMARFLMSRTRSDDPVIRMGGDEFLVLLLDESEEATAEVAARLSQAGERSAPAHFTLGWATRRKAESLAKTIDRADRRLLRVRVRERHKARRRETPALAAAGDR